MTQSKDWEWTFTWQRIFAAIAPHLLEPQTEGEVLKWLVRSLFAGVISDDELAHLTEVKIDNEVFQTIKVQFLAHNLISVSEGLTWSLTPKGKHQLLEVCSIKV